MADIKVQRGTTVIGNTGGTDTTFTSVSALTAAFERINNNRYSHAGDTAETIANREGDDMSGTLELTGTGTLTFTRQSGSLANDMRFAWEILEYIGASSGDNEFIVRSRNTVTATTNGETTQALDTTPTDTSKCIPFITGLSTDATTDSWTNATATAYINDAGSLAVNFGGQGTQNRTCQVVVVEFTGANWEVYHGTSGSTGADSGTITLNTDSDGAGGSTGDVTDWGTAAIFHTYKGEDDVVDDSIADTSATYFNTAASTTQVDWLFHANHVSAGAENIHFVHVLRHPDMVVTRFLNTGNATGANNVDVTSAGLTDLEQSFVIGSTSSSGNGTAYGRGWHNYRLSSLTNVEKWVHRSGNTIASRIQVVDLTGVTTAGTSPIAGTSAVVFGESASLTGTGTLAGTSAVVFGESAALKGSGRLSGSSTVAFSNNGVLTGTGTLAGSSAAVFATSGVLKGTGSLAGTSSITFGESADLTNAAAGSISGTSAVTFGESASLKATGKLLGTISVTFGESASLTDSAAPASGHPVAKLIRLGNYGGPRQLYGSFGSKTPDIPSGHPVVKLIRLGSYGGPRQLYGSFTGKTPDVPSAHPVAKLIRLGMYGGPRQLYGDFSSKTPSTPTVAPETHGVTRPPDRARMLLNRPRSPAPRLFRRR